jgi:hypothetical protein
MRWNILSNEKPEVGQRCMIWDPGRNRACFATWGRLGKFYKAGRATKRISSKIQFWAPQPSNPREEIKDVQV